MRVLAWLAAALTLAACGPSERAQEAREAASRARTPVPPPANHPDVMYVPTPQAVVDAMLTLAGVRAGDVLYDLGSGDGRIPITAAQRFGIRAVGIDIDEERVAAARANAKAAGVEQLVSFREEDLFTADFGEASVVTLYLLDSLNLKLRPRLLAELRPGTRIVSHAFLMGDWEPQRAIDVGGRRIYLWTVPERRTRRR